MKKIIFILSILSILSLPAAAGVDAINLLTHTNGAIIAPTNFWNANISGLTNALNSAGYTSGGGGTATNLPPGIITNTQTGVTLAGTFNGAGTVSNAVYAATATNLVGNVTLAQVTGAGNVASLGTNDIMNMTLGQLLANLGPFGTIAIVTNGMTRLTLQGDWNYVNGATAFGNVGNSPRFFLPDGWGLSGQSALDAEISNTTAPLYLASSSPGFYLGSGAVTVAMIASNANQQIVVNGTIQTNVTINGNLAAGNGAHLVVGASGVGNDLKVYGTITNTGNIISGGNVSAVAFVGDGSNVTNVQAASITGTLPTATLPGPVQMGLQPIRPYMGFVASCGRAPQNIYAGNTVYNGWKMFYTPCGFTNLICYFPNWYGNSETASGSPARISASVCQFTNGPYQQMFFAGNQYTNIPSGGMSCNDSNTIHIPPGFFWICTSYTNASGVILAPSATSIYDVETFGNTIADNTTNGIPPNVSTGPGNYYYGPIACIGQTVLPSVLVIGDSRDFGVNDQNYFITAQQSAPLFMGADRLIAPLYGCCNLSIPGDRALNYLGHPNRMYFTNFASVIWSDLGINELANGGGPTMVGTATNFFCIAGAGGKLVIAETLPPYSTSSDGFYTVANQTPNAWDTYRTNYNTLLRHRLIPYCFGVCDIAAIAESCSADGQNSGKWNVWAITNFPGAVNSMLTNETTDGLHGDYYGVAAASFGDPLRQQTPNIAPNLFAQSWAGTFTGNGTGVTNISPVGNTNASWFAAVPPPTLSATITNAVATPGTVAGTNGILIGSGVGQWLITTNASMSLILSNQYGLALTVPTNGPITISSNAVCNGTNLTFGNNNAYGQINFPNYNQPGAQTPQIAANSSGFQAGFLNAGSSYISFGGSGSVFLHSGYAYPIYCAASGGGTAFNSQSGASGAADFFENIYCESNLVFAPPASPPLAITGKVLIWCSNAATAGQGFFAIRPGSTNALNW